MLSYTSRLILYFRRQQEPQGINGFRPAEENQPNDEFKELLDWAYDLQMRDHDFESIIKLLKGRQNGR